MEPASASSSGGGRTWRAHRVLHPQAVASLAGYVAVGGLRGLAAASRRTASELIALVAAAGLRGRGGAGFSVGRKWETVAHNARAAGGATVVVNGAEGEPGTFKDRAIVRRNPYLVVEGACIAARAVGASRIVIATKASFTREVAALRRAIGELQAAGVLHPALGCDVFEGPDEYLFGEESALLEAIDGHGPFPRVVPPYRKGLHGPEGAPMHAVPALVNNLETIANLPKILERGPGWFRSVGTDDSPGTVVCTITGDVRHAGVGELRMGTPLRDAIRLLGGGPRPGTGVKAVLSGVANPVLTGDRLDVPLSYEGMAEAGSGLGAAGLMVFGHHRDMVAVAAGVARFLAIESCGQCTPCKSDGLLLADLLARLARSQATCVDLETIERRIRTVSYGARCYLARQQETVLSSIYDRYRREFEAHLLGEAPPVEPVPITELVDLHDGEAVLDHRHLHKQPDWTYRATPSGSTPIEVRGRVHR